MLSSPTHESIIVEPVLGQRPAGSLLYLPTTLTSLRTSYEAPAPEPKQRRPKSTPRKPRRDSAEMDVYHPTNYLVRGGARAYEQKIQNMNRAAIQDLRSANDMLASELLRMKSCFEEERALMKDQNTQLEVSLRMHQEKLAHQAQKLDEAAASRAALETQHAARLKELAKRLRDEHNLRTATQTEVAEQRTMVVSLSEQVSHVRELHSEVARLEATLAGSSATVTELRSRLAATETKLELEANTKNELLSRQHANEAAAASLTERATVLATSLSECETQLRAAQTGLQALEDELSHTKTSLLQEREAHAALRERSGTLQAELTQLQASSTLAAAQAAAEKSELERLRNELCDVRSQHQSATQEVSNLRDELIAARSELAGFKASSQQLGQECTQLRDQLRSTSEELQAKSEQLATAQYQADNHQAVFSENESLASRLQRTESSLRQKETVLAETLTSHAAQLELWRAEATEVAQAAAKWKQRCLLLQQQLQAREQEVGSASEDVRDLRTRCSDQEAELGSLKDTSRALEARFTTMQAELTSTKAQLKEALAAHASAARSAESSGHEAAQKSAALDMLTSRLADETAKTAALRQDLAAVTQQQVRELDAKSRMLTELTAALHKEERGRDAAQREAAQLRTHLQSLERELKNAQIALSSIQDDKLHAQEAYERAEAALANAHIKARHYKQENKILLEQCNTWLEDVAQQQQQQQQYQTPTQATPVGAPRTAAAGSNHLASGFHTPIRGEAGQAGAGFRHPPGVSPLKALEEAAEQVVQEEAAAGSHLYSANIAAARHSPDALYRPAAGLGHHNHMPRRDQGAVRVCGAGAQHARQHSPRDGNTPGGRVAAAAAGTRARPGDVVQPQNVVRPAAEFEGPFLVQPYGGYPDAYSLMEKSRHSSGMIPILDDPQPNSQVKAAFSFHVHAVPDTELPAVDGAAAARAGAGGEYVVGGAGVRGTSHGVVGGGVVTPGRAASAQPATWSNPYIHDEADEVPGGRGVAVQHTGVKTLSRGSRAELGSSDGDGQESSGSNTLERLQALLYST